MTQPTIKTISPSTREVIAERPETTIEQARRIVNDSKDAFLKFKETKLAERKSIVERALRLIDDRKELLGRELTLQMGRPIAYSTKELDTTQKRAAYLLSTCEDALADIPGQPEAGFTRWVTKQPVGPSLLVFAWNFPYLIIVNSLIPALLAGNTAILKPSPQTPLVAERLVEIFHDAGLPPTVLQLIHTGSPETLSQIVQLPDIALITFTGSTARRIVPVVLELGGNDPAYVRADADLAWTAAQLVDGAVFNGGQSCCAVERVYVHADVHAAFVEEVKELATYELGDPFDVATNVGPVISAAAAQAIDAQAADALHRGARDVTPANPSFVSVPQKGSYVAPKILVDVDHSMRVMQDETFGPVIPIAKVATDEEAVLLMNDSTYGLTASVWTKDVDAGQGIAEKLDAGTVFVNRCDYPSPDLAWTGWKNSGLGCTLGPRAFDAFFKLKSYHVKDVQA
ncbi:hypothetical protein GTA08_BOTSDO03160 [Botryosphaeria dothidea]|uniref:aldehyde dehydrogenase (NAD(+)) n=1 Tax=Botryosphaeria dothidea TaxID=55169 RepID=A0A8H4N379_9PEZI|nr:hypothetical protein GTA08_BOTSDO03160 [Botryosphaeria dothidea]